MKNINDYLELIKTVFPTEISILDFKYLQKKGYLFKNKHNLFCFFSYPDEELRDHFFLDLFVSHSSDLDKIENDYLEYSFLLSLNSIDDLKVILNAL